MAIVAVDFGARRIGVAVSESERIASPHSVIQHQGDLQRVIETLIAIGEEFDAATFLVGIPLRPGAGTADRRIHDFAEALRQRSCKAVVLWDEAYSTTEAASRRREVGKRRRSERDEIDMQAAAVILQSYLDEPRRRKP